MTTNLPWSDKLRPEVAERWEELMQLRREFHKHPELSWQEHRTAQHIIDWLKANGVEDVKSVADTGVVALIEGGQPGPTIMYRADIDALPVQEASGVEFPSENEGVMPACGHDGHTAVALILASLLNQRRQDLKGNVKVVFQPAEELVSGAQPMIEQGVMESPRIDAVFGLHMEATMPIGQLGITPGAFISGAGSFTMSIFGEGGHGAAPHTTVDPIAVGAQVVTALQTIISRNVDPQQAAVVTVGSFHAGTKGNIIPDSVEMAGTIRAFDMELLGSITQRIETITKGITGAMGARYEYQYTLGTSPVVNNADFSRRVHRHAVDLVGADSISEPVASFADDMALFMQKAQGCYFFLGAADPSKGPQNHHQPRFAFDDRSLALGLELSLRVIDEYLAE